MIKRKDLLAISSPPPQKKYQLLIFFIKQKKKWGSGILFILVLGQSRLCKGLKGLEKSLGKGPAVLEPHKVHTYMYCILK